MARQRAGGASNLVALPSLGDIAIMPPSRRRAARKKRCHVGARPNHKLSFGKERGRAPAIWTMPEPFASDFKEESHR